MNIGNDIYSQWMISYTKRASSCHNVSLTGSRWWKFWGIFVFMTFRDDRKIVSIPSSVNCTYH